MATTKIPAAEQAIFTILKQTLYPQGIPAAEAVATTAKLRRAAKAIHLVYGLVDETRGGGGAV